MTLPKIDTKLKSGLECFEVNQNPTEHCLINFWQWNQSDLLENRTRGILAEYIVKVAIGDNSTQRTEWDNYDLISNYGKKVEVKSSSYLQSWEQDKHSKISFSIAKSIGVKDHPEYDGKRRRWADYYVFCLLKHKDQNTVNPLDLNQWEFYIVDKLALDKHCQDQKVISLNSLLKLNPTIAGFRMLKKYFSRI